jgi:hypothetical protein
MSNIMRSSALAAATLLYLASAQYAHGNTFNITWTEGFGPGSAALLPPI